MSGRFLGLDGLRGIAALAIVVFHIEQIKDFNRLPSLMEHGFFAHEGGRIAVVLFFVLSGFLITCKLIDEQRSTERVRVGRFYLKRMLRIWPLYYATLLISALLLDYTPKESTFWLCILIFPNVAHATIGGWVASPQIWSIGAEEQFYLAWPWVVKWLKKHLIKMLLAICIGMTILPYVTIFLIEEFYYEAHRVNQVKTLFAATKFNLMALGGILAWLQIHKPNWSDWMRTKIASVLIVGVPFALWFTGVRFGLFNDEVFGLLFGILIVHAAIHGGGGRLLNNRPVNYLGKVSYGIYMYHYMFIILGLRFVPPVFFSSLIASNIVYYMIVFAFTLGTASLSYHLFENRFLRLKERL